MTCHPGDPRARSSRRRPAAPARRGGVAVDPVPAATATPRGRCSRRDARDGRRLRTGVARRARLRVPRRGRTRRSPRSSSSAPPTPGSSAPARSPTAPSSCRPRRCSGASPRAACSPPGWRSRPPGSPSSRRRATSPPRSPGRVLFGAGTGAAAAPALVLLAGEDDASFARMGGAIALGFSAGVLLGTLDGWRTVARRDRRARGRRWPPPRRPCRGGRPLAPGRAAGALRLGAATAAAGASFALVREPTREPARRLSQSRRHWRRARGMPSARACRAAPCSSRAPPAPRRR